MASEVFLDTSAFYASLDARDQWHDRMLELSKEPTVRAARFVTTDYVLGETLTLLQSRRIKHRAEVWLEDV